MPVFREALGSAWRGNLFWLNVGCRDMWGVLCGESLVEPKEASMSPLPQLWINHPQSVKDHLCFIPVCMMETETLNGLAWLEFGWGKARASHMDSYLKPLWKCNLKGEVWQCHQCRRTMPKLKCWHYKAFRDLIHNSTDENKLCSQTSRKEMSKEVISSFNLVLSFGQLFLCWNSSALPLYPQENFHDYFQLCSVLLIRAFVHFGLVHSTLCSNLSVCSFLTVLSEQHGTRACGTEPSVSHRGGTARHATAITAMDFYCSLSQDENSFLACQAHSLFVVEPKMWHVIPLAGSFCIQHPQVTSHCHFGKIFQSSRDVHCFTSQKYLFLLGFLLRLSILVLFAPHFLSRSLGVSHCRAKIAWGCVHQGYFSVFHSYCVNILV